MSEYRYYIIVVLILFVMSLVYCLHLNHVVIISRDVFLSNMAWMDTREILKRV